MDKAFFDTCLLIAYVFSINSLHLKSESAFNHYSEYFWSSNVVEEFDRRFYKKQKNVRSFFNDLERYLESPNQEFYRPHDLINFALKNYTDRKKDDAKSSVEPFWNRYVGFESQILFDAMKNAISLCLKDLSIDSNKNKSFLESIMQTTPQRTNDYPDIDLMLKSQGVKDADRTITLDGHDFACNCNGPIDFVSFDDECYIGAKNVELLCFNSIKGKYDFKAS